MQALSWKVHTVISTAVVIVWPTNTHVKLHMGYSTDQGVHTRYGLSDRKDNGVFLSKEIWMFYVEQGKLLSISYLILKG